MGFGKSSCSGESPAHMTHIPKCSKGCDKGIDNAQNKNITHGALVECVKMSDG